MRVVVNNRMNTPWIWPEWEGIMWNDAVRVPPVISIFLQGIDLFDDLYTVVLACDFALLTDGSNTIKTKRLITIAFKIRAWNGSYTQDKLVLMKEISIAKKQWPDK